MAIPGSVSPSTSRRAIVVLPAPEGDDRTSMSPLLAMPFPILLTRCLDLLAQLVDDGLEFEPGARGFDVGGLRADRIGFAIELLGEKVEFAADRLAARDQFVRRGDMRAQAVELLLDVGPGGQQQRLLVQAFRIESGARFREPSDQLGKPRRDRRRLLGRGGGGNFDQSRDRLELLLDHRLQPLALAAPRAHKLIKRPREARDHGKVKRRERFLALLRLGRFHHAAHAEEGVESACFSPVKSLARSATASAWRSAVSFSLISARPVSRLTQRLMVQLPRASFSWARPRALISSASKPVGRRKRRSSVRPLTLRASQFQLVSPCIPSPRAKPVMLFSVTDLKPPSSRPIVTYAAYKPSRTR